MAKRQYKFETFTDEAGKFRFHLIAGNGEIVDASQAYSTKGAVPRAIKRIKAEVMAAPIVPRRESKAKRRQPAASS